MTHDERAALESATAPGVVLTWRPDADRRFVRLQARPCPLLVKEHGVPRCTVYDSRPYACRRFGCFRQSCDEPLDVSPIPVRVLKNRDLRRQYQRLQNRAQVWALSHGWDRSMEG